MSMLLYHLEGIFTYIFTFSLTLDYLSWLIMLFIMYIALTLVGD